MYIYIYVYINIDIYIYIFLTYIHIYIYVYIYTHVYPILPTPTQAGGSGSSDKPFEMPAEVERKATDEGEEWRVHETLRLLNDQVQGYLTHQTPPPRTLQ